jgi:hypothetical protein
VVEPIGLKQRLSFEFIIFGRKEYTRLRRNLIWLSLFIIGVLTSCGSATMGTNTNPPSDRGPDRVQIQIFEVDQATPTKTITIGQIDQVKNFYQMVNSMPPYPKNALCTMEMGPHYILTFSQNNQETMTVTAERYGCKKLILDKDGLRQGTQQFWQELDQLITRAS